MDRSKTNTTPGLLAVACLVLAALWVGQASAASSGGVVMEYKPDVGNTASLQRGAKYFANYCLGCHQAKYVRYKTLGDDLGLDQDQMADTLMFTATKIYEPMVNAMPADDSERWFGIEPPDLSLIARSRGPDWLYTYLKTFHLDDSSPVGVDNLALPGVSMPHVLWELEGFKRAVYEEEQRPSGGTREVFAGFEQVTEGALTEEEYDRVVSDLVNFMVYMGEPVQLERRRIGVYVMLFLLVFFLFALMLKKEYWKDVH